MIGELAAIGKRAQPKASSGRTASSACVAPTSAEKAKIRKHVLAWIDRQFPDEKQAPASDMDGMELVFNAGCKDGSAVFADVSQDRTLVGGPLAHGNTSAWWPRTSSPSTSAIASWFGSWGACCTRQEAGGRS